MFNSDAFDDNIVIPNLSHQLGFDMDDAEQLNKQSEQGIYFIAPDIDLDRYEKIILAMSSGKDSIACLLRLIELGVDLNRVEAWHHDVDGRAGSNLMD
ncbi:hypothetical protein DS731_21805 (plasmid) [Alteromonas sp. RKMC-009]|nr:hypothetical protein DS731_21805 [Alteromonas sp. RKMC-009]